MILSNNKARITARKTKLKFSIVVVVFAASIAARTFTSIAANTVGKLDIHGHVQCRNDSVVYA